MCGFESLSFSINSLCVMQVGILQFSVLYWLCYVLIDNCAVPVINVAICNHRCNAVFFHSMLVYSMAFCGALAFHWVEGEIKHG